MEPQSYISEEIKAVKVLLIRARNLRQVATFHRDNAPQPPDTDLDRLIRKAEGRAKWYRAEARLKLQEIEKIIGGRFARYGVAMCNLKTILNGRRFRHWGGYREEYESSSMFKGVDPE